MKCFILTGLLLISGMSQAMSAVTGFAQNASTANLQTDEGQSTFNDGMRLAYIQSFLSHDLGAAFNSSGRSRESVDASGVSWGYSQIPNRGWGWNANVNLMELSPGSTLLARVDGSVAYAFNKYIHVRSGLNISRFIADREYTPGLGGQIVFGFQIYNNLSLDVGYLELHQSTVLSWRENDGTFNERKVNDKISGLEWGLAWTF